jgi:hypothetical protein
MITYLLQRFHGFHNRDATDPTVPGPPLVHVTLITWTWIFFIVAAAVLTVLGLRADSIP